MTIQFATEHNSVSVSSMRDTFTSETSICIALTSCTHCAHIHIDQRTSLLLRRATAMSYYAHYVCYAIIAAEVHAALALCS
jgi:hypothetical protein